jgi:ribose-phosphate pyrophosphokinase
MKLLAGNSNLQLSKSVAKQLGVKLADATINRFSDQEAYVEIHENIRGEDVFILQSTS